MHLTSYSRGQQRSVITRTRGHLRWNCSERRACNVYQELNFPPDIFDQINSYHEEQVKAEEHQNS